MVGDVCGWSRVGEWSCFKLCSAVLAVFVQKRSKNTGLLMPLFFHALCLSLSRTVCLFVTNVCLLILAQGNKTYGRDEKTHGP